MSKGMLFRFGAVVFLAVILGWGSQYFGSGSDTESDSSPEHTHGSEDRNVQPLEPGVRFPDIVLTDLHGDEVSTSTLIGGKNSVAIFLQIGCDACAELVAVWKNLRHTVPPGLNVVAITEEEPEYASRYAKENHFPFPLYCDEWALFALDHDMEVYPSVVGIRDNGVIAYVGKPVTAEFTPEKAWELLQGGRDPMEILNTKGNGS